MSSADDFFLSLGTKFDDFFLGFVVGFAVTRFEDSRASGGDG